MIDILIIRRMEGSPSGSKNGAAKTMDILSVQISAKIAYLKLFFSMSLSMNTTSVQKIYATESFQDPHMKQGQKVKFILFDHKKKTTTALILRMASRDSQGSVNRRKGWHQIPTIIKFILIVHLLSSSY